MGDAYSYIITTDSNNKLNDIAVNYQKIYKMSSCYDYDCDSEIVGIELCNIYNHSNILYRKLLLTDKNTLVMVTIEDFEKGLIK